ANNYELVWTSSNESVATVTGNKRKATVTGISAGTATITCTVMVNGSVFGTATCEATVNIDTSLFDSLNVAGGSLQFGTSQPYGFEAVTEGDRFLAKSNNAGVGNSTASVSTTVQMSAGDTLTFDYFYSSESNYDWYRFKANGTEVQKLSGNTNSAWATYTYTAAADGAYTFEWSYSKDNSVNRGEDCVKIDNVAFSGDAGMADGDVDGDGIVSVSDALLAMRGAMGTITLTASQLAHADLDGDGTVTASDALAIMHMAMNG
ncbi:MAG TPA: dockerin type I domain-containing protein, partial [Clostridia bacterium]|nr:dockerin type I domain-containing protein [Clostridia bacterium]